MSGPDATAALLLRLRASGIRSLDVLRAMEAVPRHAFLPDRCAAAQRDIALPIACGQTMEAPSFVARCLEALGCAARNRVLEIGTGTGFVTALLAGMAGQVVSFERYQTLAEGAQARLDPLHLAATVQWDDGLAPAAEIGRFDRIILHAAVTERPAALLDRLLPLGILVYPLQQDAATQTMMRIERDGGGRVTEEAICRSRLAVAGAGRSLTL